MADDLVWHGAWRRKLTDGGGMVTSIRVGTGASSPFAVERAPTRAPAAAREPMHLEVRTIARPSDEPITRVGRVRLTRR